MLLPFQQSTSAGRLINAAVRVFHMSERYTESEQRLLDQYKALRDIKVRFMGLTVERLSACRQLASFAMLRASAHHSVQMLG